MSLIEFDPYDVYVTRATGEVSMTSEEMPLSITQGVVAPLALTDIFTYDSMTQAMFNMPKIHRTLTTFIPRKKKRA